MILTMKSKTSGEVVKFIAFNINGKGSSLVLLEDKTLHVYSEEETMEVLEGPKNGNRKYDFIDAQG